jgi:TRAP-type C4-dicarboxylate transport system permease small subunit
MRDRYVAAMDKLYLVCVFICCASVVVMTALIAIGVFSRYVLQVGAFYSEPISIFLAIQLTFYGAAVCYRADTHLRLEIVDNALPPLPGRLLRALIDLLMAGISVFMIVFGANLVDTTMFQSYPEFEYVRVGVVYTAIPLGGLVTLLFVVEKTLFARRSRAAGPAVEGDATGRAA